MDSTGNIADPIFGDKLYQRRARKALPILVRQAKAHNPIFYSDLAEELEMPNPRNLNYVLGSIGQTLSDLSNNWNTEIPIINCLVINKSAMLPGDGISPFIENIENFSKLPLRQKKAIIDLILQEIYAYQNWDKVLDSLGLKRNKNPDFTHLQSSTPSSRSSAGESESHKMFKDFISNNPHLLNLPSYLSPGKTEKLLPSGDIPDVFFDNRNEWIAAEVKSKISDENDIYRGLYQCVKYQAVLEAYQSELGISPNCRVILVLENQFPENLIGLKNTLGIEVKDKISIHNENWL